METPATPASYQYFTNAAKTMQFSTIKGTLWETGLLTSRKIGTLRSGQIDQTWKMELLQVALIL